MKKRISILLAFVLAVGCLTADIPVSYAQETGTEEPGNVDAYYYGAGSDTCYKSGTSTRVQVSYGDAYGRAVQFKNATSLTPRTSSKTPFAAGGLHIAIENFKGNGMSFWLANTGTASAAQNALRFVVKANGYLGVNYGTNAADCDASVPFPSALSGDLEIRTTENSDHSLTVSVNGTSLTVPAEQVTANITDLSSVYVLFSVMPSQGIKSASFLLSAVHNGECRTGRIIDNRELTPKYVPDSEVTVDANGSPDWLSQLVLAEVKISAASPEKTFEGAVRLLNLYEEMGVNGIWLTPIYDGYDFTKVNDGYANAGPHTVHPSLTGETDYQKGWQVVKSFVDEAHQRNIRVFFDAITWGVAYGSPLITEHPDWFSGEAWGGAAYNWNNTALREWYISTWVNNMMTTGADGIRCDCEPEYTGYSLYNVIRQRLADQGRHIAIMSEATNTRSLSAGPPVYDMEQFGVNPATNTENNMTMSNTIFLNAVNIVNACKSGNLIGSVSLQNAGQGGCFKYYTFMLSCHDHKVPCAKGNRAYSAYQGILAPFIPLWLMGEEWNDNAVNQIQYCKTLNWDKLYRTENREYFEDYKKYIGIRWSYPEIFGYFPENHRETNICAVQTNGRMPTEVGGTYGRYGGGKAIIVATSKYGSPEKTFTLSFEDLHLPNMTKYVIRDLMSGETIAEGSREELATFQGSVQVNEIGAFLIEAAPDAEEIRTGIELTEESLYELTEDYIVKTRSDTQTALFLDNFKYRETLRLLTAKGQIMTDGIVGTGCVLQSVSGDTVMEEKTVVVYGDATGEGKVTSADYVKLKKTLQNQSLLSGAYRYAMDVNKDGTLSSVDYLQIKAALNGRKDLYR